MFNHTVPDARVVFIASIAHTLVVERSCQFSVVVFFFCPDQEEEKNHLS